MKRLHHAPFLVCLVVLAGVAACGSSGTAGGDLAADVSDVPADVAVDATLPGEDVPEDVPASDLADATTPDVPVAVDAVDSAAPDGEDTDVPLPHDVYECGPSTCPGCCDGDVCREGIVDAACGTAGGTCIPCPSGATCMEGVCAVLPVCNPVVCLGCCDGEVCHPGNDALACGKDGTACQSCEAGAACGDGECAVPPPCSPATCTGCCDGNTCVDGTADAACGTLGNACQACDVVNDATCLDGLCVAPCGPSNCAGCCYEGECLPGLGTAWACGSGGLACTDCGSMACHDSVCDECSLDGDCAEEGATCVFGHCVDTTCATTCAGCCQGGVCLAGDSDAACGVLGESCFACPQNQFCAPGDDPTHARCLVDPASQWDLIVVGGEFAAAKCNGASWDSFGGLPDPIVKAAGEWGKGITGQTSRVDDTLTPTWNQAVLADFVAGDFLGWGCLSAEDKDVALGDTLCGHCITTEEANAHQLWNDPAVWDGQIHTFVLADECTATVPQRGCKLSVRFVPR